VQIFNDSCVIKIKFFFIFFDCQSQLQAGETLRNTSHSSTAADLLQARQQLTQYQQQLEKMNVEVREHQERSSEQQEHVSQLQHKLSEMEMVRSYPVFTVYCHSFNQLHLGGCTVCCQCYLNI